MPLSWNEIKERAVKFSKEWAGTVNEEADAPYSLKLTISVHNRLALIVCVLLTHTLLSKTPGSERLIYIIHSWNDAHNDWRFKELKSIYANKVLYYGSSLAKDACIQDKTSQISPNKVFAQEIVSEISISDFGEGMFKCEFTKEVNYNKKKIRYPAYLILKYINGEPKIICESDQVTDAAMNIKITPEQVSGLKVQKIKYKSTETDDSNWLVYGLLGLICVTGGYVYIKRRKSSLKRQKKASEPIINPASTPIKETNPTNTNDENVQKGYEFEKFVVKRFSDHFFKLHHWQGDKGVDGIYPKANADPDLIYHLETGGRQYKIAVECKYRSKLYDDDTVEFQWYQIKNYNEFGTKNRMPVFIILGLGGTPSEPNELFIIPLSAVYQSKLTYKHLKNYKRYSLHSNFFYNVNIEMLQ